MLALLAGVQIESALGTLAERLRQILQQGSALRATRNRSCPRHVDGPGPESVVFLGRRLLQFFLRLAAGILVSALAILAVGQSTPPRTRLIVRLEAGSAQAFLERAGQSTELSFRYTGCYHPIEGVFEEDRYGGS